MTEELLSGSMIRLTASHGVRDRRDGRVYSEVICKSISVRFYEPADEDERSEEYAE